MGTTLLLIRHSDLNRFEHMKWKEGRSQVGGGGRSLGINAAAFSTSASPFWRGESYIPWEKCPNDSPFFSKSLGVLPYRLPLSFTMDPLSFSFVSLFFSTHANPPDTFSIPWLPPFSPLVHPWPANGMLSLSIVSRPHHTCLPFNRSFVYNGNGGSMIQRMGILPFPPSVVSHLSILVSSLPSFITPS